MHIGRACHGAVQCHTLHAMAHEGIAHGRDGGGTRLANMCCTMVYSHHCHRFSCSVMLELGSRPPIAMKWPSAVLVIWPHFNGNAQRRSAGLGLALFSSRICFFLCTSHGFPRGNSNRPGGCQQICATSVLFGRLPLAFFFAHWPV